MGRKQFLWGQGWGGDLLLMLGPFGALWTYHLIKQKEILSSKLMTLTCPLAPRKWTDECWRLGRLPCTHLSPLAPNPRFSFSLLGVWLEDYRCLTFPRPEKNPQVFSRHGLSRWVSPADLIGDGPPSTSRWQNSDFAGLQRPEGSFKCPLPSPHFLSLHPQSLQKGRV